MQTLLAGEGHVLELISTGSPLTLVLDKVSTAFDLEIGNVVSVVLLADDEEHSTHLIAQNAALFGLSIFCRAAVVSPGGELLGTFEVYSCTLRSPTPSESKLIERATQLAALAIENDNHDLDSNGFPSRWKDTMRKALAGSHRLRTE
jgi:GAF domain-containing protein